MYNVKQSEVVKDEIYFKNLFDRALDESCKTWKKTQKKGKYLYKTIYTLVEAIMYDFMNENMEEKETIEIFGENINDIIEAMTKQCITQIELEIEAEGCYNIDLVTFKREVAKRIKIFFQFNEERTIDLFGDKYLYNIEDNILEIEKKISKSGKTEDIDLRLSIDKEIRNLLKKMKKTNKSGFYEGEIELFAMLFLIWTFRNVSPKIHRKYKQIILVIEDPFIMWKHELLDFYFMLMRTICTEYNYMIEKNQMWKLGKQISSELIVFEKFTSNLVRGIDFYEQLNFKVIYKELFEMLKYSEKKQSVLENINIDILHDKVCEEYMKHSFTEESFCNLINMYTEMDKYADDFMNICHFIYDEQGDLEFVFNSNFQDEKMMDIVIFIAVLVLEESCNFCTVGNFSVLCKSIYAINKDDNYNFLCERLNMILKLSKYQEEMVLKVNLYIMDKVAKGLVLKTNSGKVCLSVEDFLNYINYYTKIFAFKEEIVAVSPLEKIRNY